MSRSIFLGIALALIAMAVITLLGACAAPIPVQTVTIIKTVPVLPPSDLYDDGADCQHGPARTSGTVYDLGQALASERGAVERCRADRAGLRQWASGVKQDGGTK